jgi:hypothetical protein
LRARCSRRRSTTRRRAAIEQLDRLIVAHSLPIETRVRLRRSLVRLAAFPHLGPALPPPNDDVRFIVGPWRWMLILSTRVDVRDAVVVVAIEDVRA